MSTLLVRLMIVSFVLSLAVPLLAAEEPAVAPPPRAEKIRVLLVTGGHDFEREPFFEVFDAAPDIAWREVQQPDAQAWYDPAKSGEYDVMVWYDMTGTISEEGRKNLLALLEKGKPVVAIHHSIANFPDWPEAINIIGGRYVLKAKEGEVASTFDHDQKMHVRIADPNHPITRFMDDFDIHDETYNFLQYKQGITPLLTVDHPRNSKVVAWTHTYRNSPITYIQLGHDSKAYVNPSYRRMVHQAIRHAAGKLPDPNQAGFVDLFNGKNLDGWKVMGDPAGFWIADGVLRSESHKGGDWMRTERTYGDFILRVEWRIGSGGNSGVFVRTRDKDAGNPWDTGSEIQITNEHRDDAHCTGSLYGSVAVNPRPDESADKWHEFWIECRGPHYRVLADNIPVIDVDGRTVPALANRPLSGYIGLQDSHNRDTYVEYRKVAVKELASSVASGEPGWRLGVQAYTFNRYSFFEAIDKAHELGLGYIEAYPGQRLRPDGNQKFDHDLPADLRQVVRKKLADAGIRLVNYGVVNVGTDEATARKVFDFAKDMGIETIVSEPDPKALPIVDRLTREYGINLAIHNHPMPSRYWNPKTVLDAVKDLNPRVGACADTGHWVRSGVNPVEALKMLEGRIISLHFKDLHKTGLDAHDVPWGTGVGDIHAQLAELHRQGFKGVFSIEYEHNWTSSMPEIAQCIAYFRRTAAEMGEPGYGGSPASAGIKLGVQTYTFNRFTFLEGVEKSRSLGLKYVEGFTWQKIGGEFGDTQLNQDAPPEVLDRLKAKLDASGVKLINIYIKTLGEDEATSRKSFEFAKRMGIETFVTEPRAEHLDLIDRLTAEYGVNLAIHNHPRQPDHAEYVNWKPEEVMKMLFGRNPRMGCCADTGHWIRSGLDPVECLRKYQGRLISLHMKDVSEAVLKGHDVPWGTGVGNVAGQLAELERQGFAGLVAIEYEHNMDNNVPDVGECVEFFRQAVGPVARR